MTRKQCATCPFRRTAKIPEATLIGFQTLALSNNPFYCHAAMLDISGKGKLKFKAKPEFHPCVGATKFKIKNKL